MLRAYVEADCHRVSNCSVGLDYYSTIMRYFSRVSSAMSQRPSDPNHPYCHYCEGSTYHEYDPYFHAWVCQTCFGGMIRVDKKDPLSVIRAELNSLALHVAKSGYNAEVKGKLREVAGRMQKLAEGS